MVTLLLIIYLAFISLGLPDSLLGSAWPTMYMEMGSTITGAGTLAMLISACTIVSSLLSDKLIHKFGTGRITAISVLTTAIALFGFSISGTYWHLVLWCIPYGLGAGAIDSALNNYVALHFKARHMSWLHCMWGVGASVGPFIMGQCILHGSWNNGYRIIGVIQLVLTIIVFFSLPMWKGDAAAAEDEQTRNVLSIKDAVKLPGAKAILLAFFAYCGMEGSTGLWAASWLVTTRGVTAEAAASYASLFYLGITIGRAGSGFISEKLGDKKMIRLGEVLVALGILLLFLPGVAVINLIGLVTIGLGCAPIYPSIIHSTPARFGKENSQSLVGIQMASAYVGSTFAPKIFGLVSDLTGLWIYPVYLVLFLLLMFFMTEHSNKHLA